MNRSDILTASGNYFDFHAPETSQFSIDDIAHALSHLCRFTGHVRQFYSVAEHSVLVSLLVPQQHALAGLLHDAAEAFIGDVAAPLKQMLPDYRVIEQRVEAAVLARFGLSLPLPPEVKAADLAMLAAERLHLMPAVPGGWEMLQGVRLPELRPACMEPTDARIWFLTRFRQLQAQAV